MEQFTQNIYRTLKEDLRLPKRQENLHITGYNKRKKKKKELGQGQHPREGAVKEEWFPHPGKSPNLREDQPGRRGALEPRSRVQQLVCGRKNGE